jgi:glycosyltransferase involved in cell wall biosynthesis
MAENYPAMIRDLRNRQGFSILNFLVRNPSAVRFVERMSLRWCDHILVVIEESRDRLISLGVDPARMSLVINTPTLARWAEFPRDGDVGASRNSHSLILVYLGLLEWARGIETAIRAIKRVHEGLPGVKLVIVGSGRDERDFRLLADQLRLQDSVRFLGWLDYSKAIEVIKESDIGLVPHHATESWNTTVPNKLFDYMSMGKPVIVSNARPTERIVREERCGIVFKEKDAEDLARAILVLTHKTTREEMGQRGREAVVRRYNWTVDEEQLLRTLDVVAKSRKQ